MHSNWTFNPLSGSLREVRLRVSQVPVDGLGVRLLAVSFQKLPLVQIGIRAVALVATIKSTFLEDIIFQ